MIFENTFFQLEDGLESVLGLSCASFGRSWASLGDLLGSSGVLLRISLGLLGGHLGPSEGLAISYGNFHQTGGIGVKIVFENVSALQSGTREQKRAPR